MNPKKKAFVNRIRQLLNLSEVDASDKDLLECFGNTSLMENTCFTIPGEKPGSVLNNGHYSAPPQA